MVLTAESRSFGGRAGGLGKGVQREAIKDVQRVNWMYIEYLMSLTKLY